jgi:hypothetical protein
MEKKIRWGKKFGCEFQMKSCKDWMENKKRSG